MTLVGRAENENFLKNSVPTDINIKIYKKMKIIVWMDVLKIHCLLRTL